uniref:G-protein coupled receptors family 1 profile domain-containing protein n=1 Tax=Trichuris muris TaxID=70415 RepID=A0A5S6Q1E2_TRIMR
MSTNRSDGCPIFYDDKAESNGLYNGFFIVVAIISLMLDCFLLAVVGRRISTQPDLYIISGFVISNVVTSLGLLCASAYRIWWRTAEPLCVHPAQCITDRFYVPMHMVGSDAVAITMVLLSLERFFLFWRQKWHSVVFSPFCTTVMVLATFLFSCLEVFAVYLDAATRSDKLISSMCYRKEYTSQIYNYVYTCTKVTLAVACLIFYVLAYVIHKVSVQKSGCPTSLGTIRNSRRSSMLFNLLIIALVIALFHIAPLVLKPLSHASPIIGKTVKIVHNLYLPLSTALCFAIHPFLLSSAQRLCSKFSCSILERFHRHTSVVYIG